MQCPCKAFGLHGTVNEVERLHISLPWPGPWQWGTRQSSGHWAGTARMAGWGLHPRAEASSAALPRGSPRQRGMDASVQRDVVGSLSPLGLE